MRASTTGINFIKQREALRTSSYKDSAGIPTIGYGSITHLNGTPIHMGEVITEGEAEKLLMVEVQEKTNRVAAMLQGVSLTQGQIDALISFGYNAGTGALKISSLLTKVRANPNDHTMIPINEVDNKAVMAYMQRKGLLEINTIHYAFMQWVYIANPKTHAKEISLGLQNRRDLEYQLYCS